MPSGFKFDYTKNIDGLDRLRALAKGLKDRESYVKIGFVGAKAEGSHEGGLTNGELATVHEFGAPRAGIPARPFVRPSFEKSRPVYLSMLERLLKGVYEGKGTIERTLGLIGAKASADIKLFVTQGDPIPPPNAPETLARKQALGKGVVRTLIDTGRMIGAASWQVVMKGSTREGG